MKTLELEIMDHITASGIVISNPTSDGYVKVRWQKSGECTFLSVDDIRTIRPMKGKEK